MAAIPQSFINSLLDRVDLVEVIGDRVQLRRAGANHMGLCPFHNEKTPSFHVYADGHYHCYGCGAHGSAIGFLMDSDGLTFPEAIETLAARLGLEVPRQQTTGKRPDAGLYDVLAAASERFQGWLKGNAEARAYLETRGVGQATATNFGLGLAPGGWDGLKTALQHFGTEMLVAAGLLVETESGRGGWVPPRSSAAGQPVAAQSGRTYDRFRDRIVFPIRDTRGRVIGFGGRTFRENSTEQAKYINSPETDVFKKRRELYGLYEARQADPRLASVVVVEGYMDVVALAQHGIANAVATLGTAIGQAHFEQLYRRNLDDVVCCFDGDDAGRAAAWKAVTAAFPVLSEGRQLRFVFLPEGEDPDSLVRTRGAEDFRARIERATSVGDYYLNHLQAGLDLKRIDHRALLCDLALPGLAQLPTGALRTMLLAALARLGQTEQTVLEQRAREAAAAPTAAPDAPAIAPPRRPLSTLGARLLALIVAAPQLVRPLEAPNAEQLTAAAAEDELLGDVLRFLQSDPEADTAALLGRFLGEPGYERLSAFAAKPPTLPADVWAAELADGAARYLAERERQQRAAMRDAVRQSESLADLQRLRDAQVARALP